MRVKLRIQRFTNLCDEVICDRFPLIVGRSDAADIKLDDRWVSRRHCEIHADAGLLVVRDLGSKYGTLLNENLITEATLKPGDTLSVGLSKLIASYECDSVECEALAAVQS